MYKKDKFHKIYYSETEAVMIEITDDLKIKDMWDYFDRFMTEKGKKKK